MISVGLYGFKKNSYHSGLGHVLSLMSLFLITLQSFYFPFFGSFLTYLGSSLLIAYCFFCFGDSVRFGYDLGFFLISCFFVVIFFTLRDTSSVEISAKANLSFFAMAFFFATFCAFYPEIESHIFFALKGVICIHLTFLLIQIIYFCFTHEYFDYLYFFIGENSRVLSKKGLQFSGVMIPRFSGLFNEPGTYSVFLVSLICCYYRFIKKIDIIVLLGVLSILATMSLFGIVLASIFFISILFVNLRFKKLLSIFVFSVLLFLIVYQAGVVQSVVTRLNSDYSGLDFRKEMLLDVFSSLDSLLFGLKYNDFKEYFVPNDLGVWFVFFVKYGVFGAGLLAASFILVAYRSRSLLNIFIFLILLLTKLKLTYPLYWFVFGVLCRKRWKSVKAGFNNRN